MAVLLNDGDMLMGELAAAEKVQPPSMTRIVNGLEERGYVARRPDPQRPAAVPGHADRGRPGGASWPTGAAGTSG